MTSFSQEIKNRKEIISLEKKADSLIYDWSYDKNYLKTTDYNFNSNETGTFNQ